MSVRCRNFLIKQNLTFVGLTGPSDLMMIGWLLVS
jgi:hypothetical protein